MAIQPQHRGTMHEMETSNGKKIVTRTNTKPYFMKMQFHSIRNFKKNCQLHRHSHTKRGIGGPRRKKKKINVCKIKLLSFLPFYFYAPKTRKSTFSTSELSVAPKKKKREEKSMNKGIKKALILWFFAETRPN